jgi:hypothetical protein
MEFLEDKDIYVFNGTRRIKLLFKFCLDMLTEIKKEHDTNLEKLVNSLSDFEDFLLDKEKIKIELAHLANHSDYLDDSKMAILRKRVLDYGNALIREMEEL